jgi:hypothetical protein
MLRPQKSYIHKTLKKRTSLRYSYTNTENTFLYTVGDATMNDATMNSFYQLNQDATTNDATKN